MNPEIIIAQFLKQQPVTALVGTRVALSQLPQNTAMPALVYQVISSNPRPVVAFQTGPQRAEARIQLNPLATSIKGVKDIHAALRTVLDFKHNQTVGGKTVVSCRFDSLGAMDKDNDAGVWTQPADYILMWYE